MNTTEKIYKAYSRLSLMEKQAFLQKIKDEANSNIVAYALDGKALTQAQYIAEIEKAIIEGETGKTLSHNSVIEQLSTWSK